MADPLATVEDLEDWLQVPHGSAPQAAAEKALRIASALVRRKAGNAFARRTDTVALPIAEGRVRLPGPVVAVASVTVAGRVLGSDERELDGDELVLAATALRGCPRRATVTWTHGYDQVPDDVMGIVLDAAARGIVNPGSVRQESTGQRSVTFATETLGISLAQIEIDKLTGYGNTDPVVRIRKG